MFTRLKKYSSVVAILLVFTAFTACEKTELDGHCSGDGQNDESFASPQDMRVNDDSDQEDSGPATNKNLSANDNTGLTLSTKNGVDPGNSASDGDDGEGDDDDLVNDDSDEEEDGRRPNNLDNIQPKAAE